LRGNVNTRLKKLEESAWDGAIFAEAGLERIHKKPANHVVLSWMLPAPAQGAIGIICKNNQEEVNQICAQLHHYETGICVEMERNFLMALDGGCSTPISALAQIEKNTLLFKGNVCAPSGETCVTIEKQYSISQFNKQQLANMAFEIAEEIKKKGAQSILNL
jgi:hydroxymethylbilane synthase